MSKVDFEPFIYVIPVPLQNHFIKRNGIFAIIHIQANTKKMRAEALQKNKKTEKIETKNLTFLIRMYSIFEYWIACILINYICIAFD